MGFRILGDSSLGLWVKRLGIGIKGVWLKLWNLQVQPVGMRGSWFGHNLGKPRSADLSHAIGGPLGVSPQNGPQANPEVKLGALSKELGLRIKGPCRVRDIWIISKTTHKSTGVLVT